MYSGVVGGGTNYFNVVFCNGGGSSVRGSAVRRFERKPTALLVLQGSHHLNLYRNVFAYCQSIQWVCFLPDISLIDRKIVDELYTSFGTQFFTDKVTALAHFNDIDVVVTTFAIPHPAHATHFAFVALANELGLPVFEIQHGLFQLGVSYKERGALIGAGIEGALGSLATRNVVSRQLLWTGESAIGYPPFSPDTLEACKLDDPIGHVLIATNFHWNLLSRPEVDKFCDIVAGGVAELPDVSFVLLPHPAEIGFPHLLRLRERLTAARLRNFQIKRPTSNREMVDLISKSRLALTGISTILLDLEMYKIPAFLFVGEKQKRLARKFVTFEEILTIDGLIQGIKDALYNNTIPCLRTGFLKRFDPTRLEALVFENLAPQKLKAERSFPIINKYLPSR